MPTLTEKLDAHHALKEEYKELKEHRKEEIGAKSHPWDRIQNGRDGASRDLLYRYPFGSAAMHDLELRALAYNESKIQTRHRAHKADPAVNPMPGRDSMEHEYMYALWQGTCHLGFPAGEFADVEAHFHSETELLKEHGLLPVEVPGTANPPPGPPPGHHPKAHAHHPKHEGPKHERHMTTDTGKYSGWQNNEGCLGRAAAEHHEGGSQYGISFKDSCTVVLDGLSNMSKYDMGNWGLACKNCAKIKNAVNEGADTVLQRESVDQEEHTHKHGKETRHEKMERKRKPKQAGQTQKLSNNLMVQQLEKHYEPKLEAVEVMKHAVKENEKLRKLAKKHHASKYPMMGNSMDHAKQKVRCCKGCDRQMEWSMYPESYNKKQYARLGHQKKANRAIRRDQKKEAKAVRKNHHQPVQANGHNEHNFNEGWRCNRCDKYYNNGPRWVCFHCFQDANGVDKRPPKTGCQWRNNEFYDCCHKCEWRHKKKKTWRRLWYLDLQDDSMNVPVGGTKAKVRGSIFGMDFAGVPNAKATTKHLGHNQRHGRKEFRHALKHAKKAGRAMVKKDKKVVHKLVAKRRDAVHKQHAEIVAEIKKIPHLYSTEVHRLKHKAKYWARAAVDQAICELVLEKIHEQNRLWNKLMAEGREHDLKARQKLKHYDEKFWEHEHNRKAALKHFTVQQVDRKKEIERQGAKVDAYVKTRPGQHIGERTKTGKAHENEGGMSGAHKHKTYNEMFGNAHFHAGNEVEARPRPHDAEHIKEHMKEFIKASHTDSDLHVFDFYGSMSIPWIMKGFRPLRHAHMHSDHLQHDEFAGTFVEVPHAVSSC